ncbi:MAG: nucleotide exchange factor GrpE [Rhodospirillales bacterium]|nr:nucleotide exchange factor GrpE [Rhodospirillales bacterium]
MSEETKNKTTAESPESEPGAENGTATENGQAGHSADDAAAAATETIADPEDLAGEDLTEEGEGPAADPAIEIARLEEESADLRDKLLRALAETENVRRRALRDKQDAAKYGMANFAREMLGVADNLRRALDHVNGDARKSNEAIESLASGVEMTERAMLSAFERFGIKPIEAMGAKFDHNLHEAMFEVQDPSQPAGTVIQEVEKGYVLEDRLLRPARVGVSKGGPAANGETADDDPSSKPEAEQTAAKEQREAYEKQSDANAEAGDAKGGKLDEQL